MTRSKSHSESGERTKAAAREKGASGFLWTFENAPVGIALIGLDSLIKQNNAALCRLLGFSSAEFFQRPFLELTHLDDLENHRSLSVKLTRGELDHYQIENRCVTRSGEVVWVKLSTTLIRDSHGTPTYGMAMLTDITDHHRIVDELRNDPQAMRLIAEGKFESVIQQVEGDSRGVKLQEVEREHILRVLEQTYWRVEGTLGAAAILGMNPGTLRSRMKKLGIRRPEPRPE